MYSAEVIQHSVSPAGVELITFEVEYPHAVHKDIMTHRWARNFQSFRAFPPEKVIEKILADPFVPEVFNTRVKGMGEGSGHQDQSLARAIWQDHIDHSVLTAQKMMGLPNGGLAKAQVNFVLQDLTWIKGIITTTMPQLANFFNLRLDTDADGNPMARPEVYKIANLMQDAYWGSKPELVHPGQWHLPYVTDEEILNTIPSPMTPDNPSWTPDWDYWKKVSAGRCARISYLTHDGVRDPDKDVELHDRLMGDGHMSPFEHQGQAIVEPWFDRDKCGSFGYGWRQYRKFIKGEAVYKGGLQGEIEGTYVIN